MEMKGMRGIKEVRGPRGIRLRGTSGVREEQPRADVAGRSQIVEPKQGIIWQES